MSCAPISSFFFRHFAPDCFVADDTVFLCLENALQRATGVYFSFIKSVSHLTLRYFQHPTRHLQTILPLLPPTLAPTSTMASALHSSLSSNMHVACPTATRVNNSHVASPVLADGQATPAASKASVTYSEVLTRKYLASVSVNIIFKQ